MIKNWGFKDVPLDKEQRSGLLDVHLKLLPGQLKQEVFTYEVDSWVTSLVGLRVVSIP